MSRFTLRAALLSGSLLACLAAPAWAQNCNTATGYGGCRGKQQDLFYNYYVPAGPMGGVPAQMYPSPRSVPPHVGHTYITYQPLMPHEFMDPHHRTYFGYQPDGGYTVTRVRWGYNPFNQVWACPRKVVPNPRPGGHLGQKLGAGVATNPFNPVNLDGAPRWYR